MRDRGNEFSFLRADLEYLHHERNVVILFKPIRYCVLEHGWREGPEGFSPLDLSIEDRLHIGTSRIAHDRPVTKRSRAPLHASLEPANHLSLGDCGGGAHAQL